MLRCDSNADDHLEFAKPLQFNISTQNPTQKHTDKQSISESNRAAQSSSTEIDECESLAFLAGGGLLDDFLEFSLFFLSSTICREVT